MAGQEGLVVQALGEKAMGEPEHERGVGVRPRGQPFGLEEVRGVGLERADVDELDPVPAAALEPIAGHVPADAARVDLGVPKRHAAEHDQELGMLGDHRPGGHGVEHVQELAAEDVGDDDLGGGGRVAVDGGGIAAELLEEAVHLALGVVEASGAGPAVGAGEDGRVAVGVLDAAELPGDQVERPLPAHLHEGLRPPAAAVSRGPALEPAPAHRRLGDAAAVPHRVLERLADRGGVGIALERVNGRDLPAHNLDLVGAPMAERPDAFVERSIHDGSGFAPQRPVPELSRSGTDQASLDRPRRRSIATAVMEPKVRRMAGNHERTRNVLRLACLIVVAKGELRAAERREFRRLCALLHVEPEQVWEELGDRASRWQIAYGCRCEKQYTVPTSRHTSINHVKSAA
jgi:hypothetical protein